MLPRANEKTEEKGQVNQQEQEGFYLRASLRSMTLVLEDTVILSHQVTCTEHPHSTLLIHHPLLHVTLMITVTSSLIIGLHSWFRQQEPELQRWVGRIGGEETGQERGD